MKKNPAPHINLYDQGPIGPNAPGASYPADDLAALCGACPSRSESDYGDCSHASDCGERAALTIADAENRLGPIGQFVYVTFRDLETGASRRFFALAPRRMPTPRELCANIRFFSVVAKDGEPTNELFVATVDEVRVRPARMNLFYGELELVGKAGL